MTQEIHDGRHVIISRACIFLFPIHESHFVAADDFRDVNLSESEIEPTFANGFTNCFWIGRISPYLRKVRPMRATNPM